MLGIDPGLRLTGFAVLDIIDPDRFDQAGVVEAGVFRLDQRRSVSEWLVELHRDLSDLLHRTAPGAAAVEAVWTHSVHPMTGVVMAHARGVVLLTLQQAGLPLVELPPTAVKKALTGNGHAPKAQVQAAVATVLRLAMTPEPADVADAMAIALTAAGRLAREASGA